MNNDKIKKARHDLGLFIKNRREEIGASLQQLAYHVGITPNTLNGVETGRFAMDIDLAFRIYQALEIKPYFSVTKPDDHYPDVSGKKENDPERYHGFYLSDNILLYPDQLAIIKLSYPRVFVRFNYGDSFFINYDDWKNNIAVVEWLDPEDKPDQDGIDEILTDCWNFLCLSERAQDEFLEEE